MKNFLHPLVFLSPPHVCQIPQQPYKVLVRLRCLAFRQTESTRASVGPIICPSARSAAPRVFLGGFSSGPRFRIFSSKQQSRQDRTGTMRSARGSSRALVCSTALVLVLLSSAHEGWRSGYSGLCLLPNSRDYFVYLFCFRPHGREPCLFVIYFCDVDNYALTMQQIHFY